MKCSYLSSSMSGMARLLFYTSLPTTPCSPVQRAAGHWAGIATLGKLHSCQAKAARCQASGQHTACIVLAGQRRTASYFSDSRASGDQGGG